MGLSAYGTVLAADGGEKRVEEIDVGDRLLDAASGGVAVVRDVWRGPGVGMMRLTARSGEVLDVTGDQFVLTLAGPVAAAQAAPGAHLRTYAGATDLSGAAAIPGDYMVYDVELEPAGAFILVNGIAVGWKG